MGLPNLNGYWKYGDAIVPFRIEPQDRPQRARAYIPRQSRQVNELQLPTELPAALTPAKGNCREEERAPAIDIVTNDTGELERRF